MKRTSMKYISYKQAFSAVFLISFFSIFSVAANQETDNTDNYEAFNDCQKVSKNICDAVVLVRSYNGVSNVFQPYKAPEQSSNTGSAFFINDQGYLITNFHVIEQASFGIVIEIPSLGKEQFEVEVVRCIPEKDAALLRLTQQGKEDLEYELNSASASSKFLKLGNSDLVQKTQKLICLGYPLSDESLKITRGDISGKHRIDGQHYIQVTVPINFGNSGGPLVNQEGQVIGIATRMIPWAQNTGYIMPINEIKSLLHAVNQEKNEIIEKQAVWGLASFSPTSKALHEYYGNSCKGGVYLVNLIPGGLLEKNGIQKGDIWFEVNGHSIDRHGHVKVDWCPDDTVSFIDVLNRLQPGDDVSIVVDRNGERIDTHFKVEVKEIYALEKMYPTFQELDYEVLGGTVFMELTVTHLEHLISRYVMQIRDGHIGLLDSALTNFLRLENRLKPCIFVSHLFPHSQATKHNLRMFDIISKVNEQEVYTLQELRSALMKSRETGFIKLDTFYDEPVILKLDAVLKEEDDLAHRHHFEISNLVNDLS